MLPHDLISELRSRKLMVLSQFCIPGGAVPSECWRSAVDLNLPPRWHMDWGHYVSLLAFSGIRLNDSADKLVWDSPVSKGFMSVRSAYNTMAYFGLNPPSMSWWHHRLWRWNLPVKNKCFLWLCLQNKILTWANIQRRGFHGPGISTLCLAADEGIQHLFF